MFRDDGFDKNHFKALKHHQHWQSASFQHHSPESPFLQLQAVEGQRGEGEQPPKEVSQPWFHEAGEGMMNHH